MIKILSYSIHKVNENPFFFSYGFPTLRENCTMNSMCGKEKLFCIVSCFHPQIPQWSTTYSHWYNNRVIAKSYFGKLSITSLYGLQVMFKHYSWSFWRTYCSSTSCHKMTWIRLMSSILSKNILLFKIFRLWFKPPIGSN